MRALTRGSGYDPEPTWTRRGELRHDMPCISLSTMAGPLVRLHDTSTGRSLLLKSRISGPLAQPSFTVDDQQGHPGRPAIFSRA